MDPLLSAVEKCNVEVVTILLEHGANPNTRVADKTALAIAREKHYTEIEEILVKAGARDQKPFFKGLYCFGC